MQWFIALFCSSPSSCSTTSSSSYLLLCVACCVFCVTAAACLPVATAEDNALRKFPMSALGAAPSRELQLRTMDWAVKSGDVKLQDFFYPMGAVCHSGKEGAQLTFEYFKENREQLKEMLSKASPSLMDAVIVSCCGGFSSLEKAAELEAFFAEHPFPSSARRIENM